MFPSLYVLHCFIPAASVDFISGHRVLHTKLLHPRRTSNSAMPFGRRKEDSTESRSWISRQIRRGVVAADPGKFISLATYSLSGHILTKPCQFAVYVGFFNAFSSLINQILYPYGFSEVQAGICGALLIVVGLVTSGIVSPVLGRHPRLQLMALKLEVPLLAVALFAFIWAPQTRSVAAPYVLASIIGASAFSLMPLALEMLADVTHPVSPEITSVVSWFGGSLLGALFILIMDALKDGRDAKPPYRMRRALIFEGVVAVAVVPLPLCLGLFGRRLTSKRLETDTRVAQDRIALTH